MNIKTFISNTLSNFTKSMSKVFIKKSDIENNLTSTDTDKPQAAYQGKVLGDRLESLETLMPKVPRNINVFSHNISVSGSATSTVQLSSGIYVITQSHPFGPNILYLVSCMGGYSGKVTPIIEDSCATITIDNSCVVTIKTVMGNGNFRWYHILKVNGLAELSVE